VTVLTQASGTSSGGLRHHQGKGTESGTEMGITSCGTIKGID